MIGAHDVGFELVALVGVPRLLILHHSDTHIHHATSDVGPCFWTKASAVSATSRQPLSIVSACPRFGTLAISVTPSLRRCRLYDALAMAHGTVWSSSPS